MSKSITSANATWTMTIETVFNAPFILENWAVDNSWNTEDLEQIETRMSMDGFLNKGFVWRPVTTTLTFQPGSSSIAKFQLLQQGQMAGMTTYDVGGTLILPDLNRRFTFEGGCMTRGSVMPNGGGTLAEQAFTFVWERVYPVAI